MTGSFPFAAPARPSSWDAPLDQIRPAVRLEGGFGDSGFPGSSLNLGAARSDPPVVVPDSPPASVGGAQLDSQSQAPATQPDPFAESQLDGESMTPNDFAQAKVGVIEHY